MPRLLQIDSCLGVLSTGRITEGIAGVAAEHGWDCYIAHGARYVGKSKMTSYQVGTKLGEYLHYAQSLLFDRHGQGSALATRRLIKKIEKEIKPDIIHLHCIHGYYLNYKVLFEYLNQTDIPVVWTFHDCWAFTGHCAYFDYVGCEKWKWGCRSCELTDNYPRSLGIDLSPLNYKQKKYLFSSIKDLIIVPVSDWLKELVGFSFLNNYTCVTVHNGINLEIFSPDITTNVRNKYVIGTSDIILGVAAQWDKRKGLGDFIRLRELLDDSFVIVLVGLSQKQIEDLPAGIIGIKRTDSAGELAQLYKEALTFVNPTYSDNFPTVNLEALACGTPVITYDTGGSPEAVDEKTGVVVPQGDVYALAQAIRSMKEHPLSSEACRQRAEKEFNQENCYMKYLDLYERLIGKRPVGGGIED